MNTKDTVRVFFPWKWILATIIILIAAIATIDATVGIPDKNSAMIGYSAGQIIVSVWVIVSLCKWIAHYKKQKRSKKVK